MKSVTTILFVENDAVALTMYQKRLQREGFHVEIAEDGIAALRVLSEMTPDIVILDLMLPKFSGKDVFDYMRADAQFKNVPVIIFSNAPRTEWPQNPEESPTRALPKSEANFASLLELIREMTTAAPAPKPAVAPATKPVPAVKAAAVNAAAAAPQVEPDIFVKAPSAPSTATETAAIADELASPETLDQFLEYATTDMSGIREHCLAFIKAPSTDVGRTNLSALRQRLHALDIGAQKIRCARLSLLAGAWEALLAEIERKPSIASPSVLQTLAQAADCLRILLAGDRTTAMQPLPKARVLSVDDDEICNHVAVTALESANMNADSVMDANAALELVKENAYDLILLDINMPGLTGFELCEKLRALPQHQKTPVIFVTAYNNFENRKQSVLSGGGDLIAKPVSPLELALKVTIHLLKAPPKPAAATGASPAPEAELVWKEPAETISHDAELHLDAATSGRTPNVVLSTTQTRTTEPDPAEVAAVAPPPKPTSAPATPKPASAAPTLKMTSEPVPTDTSAPASKMKDEPVQPEAPAPAIKMKEDAPKASAEPVSPSAPPAPPIPPAAKPSASPVEPKPILESAAKSTPLPEKGKVVPTQPPRISQPTASPSNGSSKSKQIMNKENNQQFETLVLDVAHIIFGDNAPDINVRLVRMALEQVWQNRANLESIDSIAREIARIIFGDNAATDLNVRLVRMALERSNSIALFKAA